MKRRRVPIVLTVLAATAFLLGASTYSAYTDYGDVTGNAIDGGMLQLNLAIGRAGNASLDLDNVAPGGTAAQTIWASSDRRSATPANLYLTFDNLADHAGPCATSRGKATGELESGIGGCTVTGETVSGTPAQGNLSRVLSLRVGYYPAIHHAADCAAASASEPSTVIMAEAPGNLYASATANHGAGIRYRLSAAGSTAALTVAPGSGVCVGIDADWPPDPGRARHPSPQGPSDNAAQGDSLGVDVRFDLVQAH